MSVAPAQPIIQCESEFLAQIEAHLALSVERSCLVPNLREAVRYALLGGGKRLRPLLTLVCAEVAGGRREDALDAASAVEMVHAFSLVHDDLPALDNDDLRRGRPTLHIARGEAMAILAGDALLSLAFETAARSPRHSDRLVAELASATTAMINGQVLDTLGGFDASQSAAQRLDQVHRNKTGALIRAACRMGSIAVSAPDEIIEQLTRWGDTIGLMFQVVDDLIDETQTAEHAGKAVGKDRAAGKLTWPAVHGIPTTRSEIDRLAREAHQVTEPLGADASHLREITDYLATRTR
ncbi:MAG: polyprenyl synthetase family protein [Phycisphaeraceae bacterium]|nr:polyprenyl synthetase family protein [Phycisphaeraceae bacterium]